MNACYFFLSFQNVLVYKQNPRGIRLTLSHHDKDRNYINTCNPKLPLLKNVLTMKQKQMIEME